jgi:hypothetical protein
VIRQSCIDLMDHLDHLVNDRVMEKGMEMDLGREKDMDQMTMDLVIMDLVIMDLVVMVLVVMVLVVMVLVVMALRQMERVLTDLPTLLDPMDLLILLGMNTRLRKDTDITHPMDFPMVLNHIHLHRPWWLTNWNPWWPWRSWPWRTRSWRTRPW